MPPQSELDRIQAEYTRRKHDPKLVGLYSPFNKGSLFSQQHQERGILQALKQHNFSNLQNTKILDIGVGNGYHLLHFVKYGANPQNLVGVDLMPNRLRQASIVLPHSQFMQANGGELPFANKTFDIILMFTVLSSIIDSDLRQAIANQIKRLVKPTGLILIYDFKQTSGNAHLQGVTQTEIKTLFGGLQLTFTPMALPMSIAWRLAPRSWFLCELLARFPLLKTHYLATIQPV